MRLATCVATVSAVLVLAGCGSSSSSSVPVESGSASGSVAAAGDPCPQGAPASGQFSGVQDAGHDGVVGSLRNDTGTTVWVRGLEGGEPCTLAPGQGVAYAGSHRAVDLYLQKKLPPWVPLMENFGSRKAGQLDWDSAVLISQGPDGGSPGIVVAFVDPNDGLASARTWYRTADGFKCPPASHLHTNLWAGEEEALSGSTQGTVTVKRLSDDKAAARQWSGVDSWKVNDWARIDVAVQSFGTC